MVASLDVSLEIDELRSWLEWAGTTFLSMQLTAPGPKPVRCAWPEYAQDATEAYGYSGERLRPAIPRGKEIELMDDLMTLPSLIRHVPTRRVVGSRMFVRPINQKHLYSWAKLAFMLHTDRRNVVAMHARGLREIAAKLEPSRVYTFRRSATALAI